MKRYIRLLYYTVFLPYRAYKAKRVMKGPTVTLSKPGTADWLIVTERRFGGFVKNVQVNTVSEVDPRDYDDVLKQGMQGGDRMAFHGYAGEYEKYLAPFIDKHKRGLLVEIGILKGQGLALWCELFPEWRVVGLDIDLHNAVANDEHLRSVGAFATNKPELHKFDQLLVDKYPINNWLQGNRPNIVIDDGLHSAESVFNTARVFLPQMSGEAVYIVEDFTEDVNTLTEIARSHGFETYRSGKFTALLRV